MKKIGTIGILVLVFLAMGAFNARASSLADIFGPSVREPDIEILSTGEVIPLDTLYERRMTIEPYYPEEGNGWVWKINSSWTEIASSEEDIRQNIASFKLSFVPRKEPRIFRIQVYYVIEVHAGFGYGEEFLITSPEGQMRGTTVGGLVKYYAVFVYQPEAAREFFQRVSRAYENKERISLEAHFIWSHPQLGLIPPEEMRSFTYYGTGFWKIVSE